MDMHCPPAGPEEVDQLANELIRDYGGDALAWVQETIGELIQDGEFEAAKKWQPAQKALEAKLL